MNSDERHEIRSPITRFLDNFLQERNIQWVLAVGMLIVLGSTLMLAVTHWSDYTPIWKCLIMLGYTGAIYFAGRWTYHEMSLRKTGTVLMALTVLLVPVLFLALHWVQHPDLEQGSMIAQVIGGGDRTAGIGNQFGGIAGSVASVSLWIATLAFSAHAARRIFDHFFRKRQTTFLASYLALCVSGGLAPIVPDRFAPWTALVLWAVFALGSTKINRHVFWLAEEHSAPRIFGFFPIALLAAQFLTIYAINFASRIPLEWLGFGCVLVAVPVLLTADSVARVFQQRTGDVVRPLPWSIVIPLLAGLALCATGVCMASAGLIPPRSPYALVPAASLVAAIMFVVARRTKKRAFVVSTLAAITLAYNFSPVFFQELARQLVQSSADAVREQKLPYAFYGVTYLPLIVALTVTGTLVRRGGDRLFGPTTRAFSIILAGLLLAVSLAHTKAMLPVALLMVVMFGAQTVCYRSPPLAVPAVIALIIAAHGLMPFCNSVFQWQLPPESRLLSMAGASALLLTPGFWVDRRLRSIALHATPGTRSVLFELPICQAASLCVALWLSANWLVSGGDLHAIIDVIPVNGVGMAAGIASAMLLVIHSLRWVAPNFTEATSQGTAIVRASSNAGVLQPMLAGVALVFSFIAGATIALRAGIDLGTVTSVMVLVLFAGWLVSYAFERHHTSILARAFARANRLLTLWGLTLAVVGSLPFALSDMMCVPRVLPGIEELTPWWLCRVVVIGWCFDAARRCRSKFFTGLGCLAAFALVGAAFIELSGARGWHWLPAAWAVTAVACLPVAEILKRRADRPIVLTERALPVDSYAALAGPINVAVFGLLSFASVASLGFFTFPMRVAGAIGLAGLLAIAALRRQTTVQTVSLALVNWQLLALTIVLMAPGRVHTLLDLVSAEALAVCLPVAVVAALSLLAWQWFGRTSPLVVDAFGVHIAALRVIAATTLAASLAIRAPTAFELLGALIVFLILIASALQAACRNASESCVWMAQALLGAAVGYFAWHGVIHFGRGISMFAVMASALLAWLIGRLTAGRGAAAIMSRPFQQTALALPALTVMLGLYRHIAVPHAVWLGTNSLALLLASGFYFCHGVERRQRWPLLASAAVLNIALILLWRDLEWSDPQFYMIPIGLSILALVRLLHAEIPAAAHAPLNYLGALVILVSPTFHIVTGSWLHLFSLMLLSVCVVLGAIGFRVRAMMYAGGAFLVADLVAMVIRSSIDNPNLLWIAGVALGAGVVALGAAAERNRESLLQRLRMVSATIQSWS
jgi:hypothetical protein